MFVPVIDKNQKPLMPTKPSRARRWIKEGKATPFWKRGIFCVRLNVEPSALNLDEIVVGIDPGSKKEGYTVKSKLHTYLNLQADAVTHVKDAVEARRNMRRGRRFRKTPCRKNKRNRLGRGMPPSTKARWQWKLRICNWLKKLFPVTSFIVEDIKAKTKGQRRWDMSFSPLEVGKKWFYDELSKLGTLTTKQGYETKELRDLVGLKKSKAKMSDRFDAHCVDSWVLCNSVVGGHVLPDNEKLIKIIPLIFHRHQLHAFQPAKKGVRRPYGSTRSLGLTRGSLVKHKKHGLSYVGGTYKGRISLHGFDGVRLTQSAKVTDCKFLTYNTWRIVNTSPRPEIR